MMFEPGMSGGGGGDKLPLESSSDINNFQEGSGYQPYPPRRAAYEDVLNSRDLFMDTLKKLHASMGTKFMIPVVGGRDLDLYRLFSEVTSRGGIAKVINERKWKEVTAAFSFPSSATNASFILRKYYVSLLYHYEQIYFFEAKYWSPSPVVGTQNMPTNPAPPHRLPECLPSQTAPSAASPQLKGNTAKSTPAVSSEPSTGSPICGVIDGKFESGYLITVKVGSEECRGVLYQVPDNESHLPPIHHGGPQAQGESVKFINHSLEAPRRKRRKKSEIRRRDPAHPKPNRSGYNFFFAEQHARLKPLYHGKDREISRIIGELWNKLQEPERAVYQEKALKDKERYKVEMEDYRERLRTGQIIRSAVPMDPHPQLMEANLTDISSTPRFEGATSGYTDENEMSSFKSGKSNLEEFESADKDSDFVEHSESDRQLKNVDIEVLADEAFNFQTRNNGVEGDGDKVQQGTSDDSKILSSCELNNLALGGGGILSPGEEEKVPPCNANESVPVPNL